MNFISQIQLLFITDENRKTLLQKISFIALAFLASMLTMACVHPELLVTHSLSFMYQHDLEIPMENIFTLVSHFYHGGIQLWNPYDQMSYGYSHLTLGLYTLANIMTASLYILFSSLFTYQGEAFHHFHALGFYSIATLIRTLGGYLLVCKFSRNPFIVLISLVLFNTILSSQMYLGLVTNNLYSYLPLLLYFILRFFEYFRLNDFLSFLVVMTLCVANSPFIGLGYFYLSVHYFVLICLVLFFVRIIKVRVKEQRYHFQLSMPSVKKEHFKPLMKIGGVFVLCAFLILPSLIMAKSLKSDHYIPGSGVGETQGRLKNLFSVSKYFNEGGRSSAEAGEFFTRSFDFTKNKWSISWVFMGGVVFHFAWMGLVLSRNRVKHVFFWTVVLIVLANTPRQATLWTSAAHWVNALTNPFSFLLRSFHMSALLIPYYVLPLAVLGFQSCLDLVRRRYDNVYTGRVVFCLTACCALLALFIFTTVYPVKQYGVFSVLAVICLLYFILLNQQQSTLAIHQNPIRRWWGVLGCLLITALLIADLWALSVYVRNDPYSRYEIEPRDYEDLGVKTAILDYQNPAILPRRTYFRFEDKIISPRIFSKQNHYGLFYQFTPMDRNLLPLSIYSPIHRNYKMLHTSRLTQNYLKRNQELISFADYAVVQSPLLPFIYSSNLERNIILIDADEGDDIPYILRNLSLFRPKGRVKSWMKSLQFSFDFNEGHLERKNELAEYSFNLPGDFPGYVSTTVFTRDKNTIKCSLNGRDLDTVQGKLTGPFQFDVQNIHKGKLFISLPVDAQIQADSILLEIQSRSDIVDIWRNEYDNFGFTYEAPYDGWLVMHYPYDEKWRLKVDGQIQPVYRVNNYFIGTPLTKGKREILLQYWPSSPLRPLIGLSMILIVGAFFGTVLRGLMLKYPVGNK